MDCPSGTGCVRGLCIELCQQARPCGINAVCDVLDTLPVRTMTCTCLEGYEGDASLECTPVKVCEEGRGLILNEREECVCPPGHAFDENGVCIPCRYEDGFVVDPRGYCVCDKDRGLVFTPSSGKCECPPGYFVNANGICEEGA